jgi:hypothetical protein
MLAKGASMPHLPNKERLLKELKVRKIHLYPRLFALLPPQTAAQFASRWEPVERLAATLSLLPLSAMIFLLNSPTGALVVSPDNLLYVRGPQLLHKTQLENVAFVPAAALLEGPVEPLRVVAQLYNHLLGSAGATDGPCLSDGVGITPAWTEVGVQIPRLFALGHNPDPICRASPADYFAQSVALYAARQRELNVADPNMHKLLTRSFFSENFWRHKNANT